jgi:hypothetical protein
MDPILPGDMNPLVDVTARPSEYQAQYDEDNPVPYDALEGGYSEGESDDL